MKVIINGTGLDTITIWNYDGRNVRFESFRNRTWIFVHGTPYDVDFLANQLDRVHWVSYSRERMRDVYGYLDGLRISLNPSMVPEITRAIDTIGMGRKYSIYNGDINPVLRIMSEKSLNFFNLENPEDMDVEIPWVSIVPVYSSGGLKHIVIDGDVVKPHRSGLETAYEAIRNSRFIIYGNRGNSFTSMLEELSNSGLYIKGVHAGKMSVYQSYGQVHYKGPWIRIDGKMCMDMDSFILRESGMEGSYAMSRMSSLPLEYTAVVTPGTAVSSMEVSHAIGRGILIPLYKNDHEEWKSVWDILDRDRGGLVLQPDPGLYCNVYEIDFSSMYPSIMVNYNLSPETVTGSKRPVVGEFSHGGNRGFLSESLQHLLETRLFYKGIKWKNPVYAARDTALKWMLLTSFGYTGYKNAKFGKIEVHEAITSLGRDILACSIGIAHRMGFRVIHGIVDSMWIMGDGDVDKLIREIESETGIGIVLDGYYRWIVFLPSRSGIGALNRYMGLRHDGTFKVRGIELRRNDIPNIVKQFQKDALRLFSQCMNPADIYSKRLDLRDLENSYMERIRNFSQDDIENYRINFKITRRREEYSVKTIQKQALDILIRSGIEVNPGERIPVSVADRKRGILNLQPDEAGIDRKFYIKYMKRAFESFDYLVQASSPLCVQRDIREYFQ
ncbi:type B DNA-directed DNA polymerase [Oxyplasma meridianum]|uniref:DNA-directed DNA polymerase n=1 Tax=Oxyplasma meridianum TaxID=3073602 RepID=A0AAX4NHG0_9ARCH